MEDRVVQFIRNAQDSVEYGMVQFTMKKHDGLVSSIDANKTASYKVKNNAEALAIQAQLMKAIEAQILLETQVPDANYTPPNLTFTLFFSKDGQADRVHVNDFKRKTFK